jgi:hypothetical protein
MACTFDRFRYDDSFTIHCLAATRHELNGASGQDLARQDGGTTAPAVFPDAR